MMRLIPLALGVALLAAPGARGASLPHPDLTAVEPAVREQLAALGEETERRLAAGPPEAALEAIDRLGEAYLAYDFLDAAEACLRFGLDRAPGDFRRLYLLGFDLERQGRLEEASEVLERALAVRPGDAAAAIRRGRILLHRDRPEAARALFERAATAAPRCSLAPLGLGLAAQVQGNWNAAAAALRRALDLAPDLLEARYALALALRHLGRDDEARRLLAEVDLAAAQPSGDTWENGPGCADPLVAEVGRHATGAAAHLLRATLAHLRGELDVEIAEDRQAVAAEPADPVARKSLAGALATKGELDAARRELTEVVRLAPDDPAYRFDLGQILRRTGDLDGAAAAYQAALERFPDFAQAHLLLGELELQRRHFRDAADHLARGLELAPEEHRFRVQLAVAHAGLGQRDEALTELSRLLSPDGATRPEDRFNAATMMVLLGDSEDAEPELDRLARSGADDALRARAFFTLAQLAAARGEHAGAVADLRSAIALDPDLAPARELLDRLSGGE